MKSFDYSTDPHFTALLNRSPEVNHVGINCEIAQEFDPSVRLASVQSWLDKRAEEIRPEILQTHDQRRQLQVLAAHLGGQWGLHGDRLAYMRPEASFVSHVIESGIGLPISLALIYISVGARLGIELEGIGAPHHFLCRYEGIDETLYLDAYNPGRLMSTRECIQWLSNLADLSPAQVQQRLNPVTDRDFVIRQLNNLKQLFLSHDNWEAAWKVQRRLSTLTPGSFLERRDLALIALKSDHPGLAVDLLKEVIPAAPENEQPILKTHLQNALSEVSRWN